jgi:hypothetical protein
VALRPYNPPVVDPATSHVVRQASAPAQAAQRAFFQAALGAQAVQTPRPAVQAQPTVRPTPVAQATPEAAEDASPRFRRPGSIIDIKV